MRDFPVEMQGDIAFELHKDVLALPLFEDASQGCLKAMAMQVSLLRLIQYSISSLYAGPRTKQPVITPTMWPSTSSDLHAAHIAFKPFKPITYYSIFHTDIKQDYCKVNNFCQSNIKFYPYTKIGILDILTKLYIIYAYISIPDTI
jgi:hypothetical protein